MSEVFKEARVSPEEILAGDSAQITFRLVVGPAGTAGKCRIVIDCPAYLGYDRPSRMDQETGGYVALFCSNPDVDYTERVWDMEVMDFPTREKTSFKGMAARMIVLDLDGRLEEDDELVVRWGWMRNGHAVGTKVATVVPVPDFENLAHVRYFSDPTAGLPDLGRSFEGYRRPVPDVEIPLSWKIRPREPARLRLFRGPARARLVPYDRFYNVADVPEPESLVEVSADAEWERNGHGVFEFPDPHVRVVSRRLPLAETPRRTGVFEGLNLYFGDLHTHSQYSNDCIEREKLLRPPEDLHAYAREVACIDFHNVADHHQPWDVPRNRIGAKLWERTLEAAREHHRPGEFVTVTGFEYRGPRGDTAVVLGEEMDYAEIDRDEYDRVDRMWEGLQGRDFITIPHFHNPGGLDEGEWIAAESPAVEPVLEIYSCHGSYEAPDVNERHIPQIKSRRPDRFGRYFLKQGYRYGFVASSDGHKGVVGNNGLTAVFAAELTRSGILEAIRARRCYGTTNARIRLVFTVNGMLMGSELPEADEARIRIDAAGEERLKAVDLFKNGELHRRWRPRGMEFATELVEPVEAPCSFYVRVIQMDNHLAWSSPVWVG
ncbi:MAG: hypothetical protein PVJ27_05540 [Candidatus Brocadiaceae bacterium]|jgi:hypothetical protein